MSIPPTHHPTHIISYIITWHKSHSTKLLDLNFSKFPKTKSKLLAELTHVLETQIPQLMAMYVRIRLGNACAQYTCTHVYVKQHSPV